MANQFSLILKINISQRRCCFFRYELYNYKHVAFEKIFEKNTYRQARRRPTAFSKCFDRNSL